MGRIYSKARRTLIWLGEDAGNDAPIAFSFLKDLHAHFCQHSTPIALQGRGAYVGRIGHELRENILKYWLPSFNRVWRCLAGNPWFQRLWVVQEVALAWDSMIIWGRATITLGLVFETIKAMSVCQYSISYQGPTSLNSLIRIHAIRSTLWNETEGEFREHKWMTHYQNAGRRHVTLSILDLLHQTESFKCTDARDKIYALLGLVSTPGFTVDYTLSVEQVFLGFSKWALGHFKDLRLLSYARGVAKSSLDIPSWVVGPEPSHVVEKIAFRKKFDATTRSESNTKPSHAPLWSIIDGHVLKVQSRLVDTVLKVAKPVPLGGMDNTTQVTTPKSALRHIRIVLAEAIKITECDSGSQTDICFQKFCRAIHCLPIEGTRENIQWAMDIHEYLTKEILQAQLVGPWRKDKTAYSLEDSLGGSYDRWVGRLSKRTQNYNSDYIPKSAFGRGFCVTGNDRFAWVPLQTEPNDKIYVIRGANVLSRSQAQD